jgi:hypothetical protein
MYKEASKQKLRIATDRGSLSVEQLWDLKATELDGIAVSLDAQYKTSKGKSFIVKKTIKDKIIKLKFDVVLDILTTKLEENETLLNAKGVREHNEKIMTIIAKKQDESLEGLSIKDLEKQLK